MLPLSVVNPFHHQGMKDNSNAGNETGDAPSDSLGCFGTIFLICGVFRSGSTWSFNVIREGAIRMNLTAYQAAGFPDEEFTKHDIALFKIHLAPASVMDRFWKFDQSCKIVITRRAPIDCVGSMMLTFGLGFDLALKRVRESFEFSAQLVREKKALVIDYRRIVEAPEEECSKLLAFAFGSDCASKFSSPVNLATDRSRLASMSHALRPDDPDIVMQGTTSYYDNKTFLHRRHVNRTEKSYATMLTEQQKETIINQIRPF